MPAVIPAVIGGVVVAGGVAAYYKFRSPVFARLGGIKPGSPPITLAGHKKVYGKSALVPLVTKAKPAPITETEGPAQKSGAYAGAPTKIDATAGFQPVYIERAEGKFLEWGACFFQWSKDLGQRMSDHDAGKTMIGVVGQIQGWIITVSGLGPIINGLLCFRMWLSAIKIKIKNGPELWGPTVPGGADKIAQKGQYGELVIPGWNPNTTRESFAAEYGPWPLDWPTPAGTIGAAWYRNLGDLAGVGHDVYQLITSSYGSERSFPMMSQAGWRAVLRLNGQRPWGPMIDGRNGVREMFQAWKAPGQTGIKRRWSAKKKATNRYK